MKRFLLIINMLFVLLILMSCISDITDSMLKSKKQSVKESETELINNIVTNDEDEDEYDPKYTQIWESKNKNISFNIVNKYGIEGGRNRYTGKFYGEDIGIIVDVCRPRQKYDYDGEILFYKEYEKKNMAYELFTGKYKLSKDQKSLTIVICTLYNHKDYKWDKHGIKKGNKIVFTHKSGPKSQTRNTE